ncbi:hypothetical protein [Streptomyces xantholiticus]|uniref:hypothetical protein n=1 Tax=Streptomyces xantholiticus TaxID=68285 RepID=UPI0016799C11|nr:hypothetical protein [Streptomyces xantholiticus]GGW25177.1 hypothetical protein GCM10010381_05840 [Streptomyces xantholiticus]
MAVHQLPADVRAFARYFGELAARLDPHGGWYAIFRQRDPEGMRACLDGSEIPPWDVVESLLRDLPAVEEAEFTRASGLHAAAAAAYDRLPGGREMLAERAELMRHERLRAQARAEELLRLLPGSPDADRLAYDLAWARDDHARAVRRQTELESRAAAVASYDGPGDTAPPPPGAASTGPGRPLAPTWDQAPPSGPAHGQGQHPVSGGPVAHGVQPAEAPRGFGKGWGGGVSPRGGDGVPPTPKKPRRPRGGARFAGVEDVADDAVAVPLLPVSGDTPRGARYGGASVADPVPEAADPAPDDGADRAARETVAALARLRAHGRGGEAHALICEAAASPAPWLPALADELHRLGLAADWATLLWEVASQPVSRLAAAADALIAAGRGDDGRQLLRQGVFRSADEIADAVIALQDEGMPHRARTLLTAFVSVHTPADVAAVAAGDPARLVPLLLDAARSGAPARERDIVHALRVAGHIHS